jgi:CheY-like chemotaxis protein
MRSEGLGQGSEFVVHLPLANHVAAMSQGPSARNPSTDEMSDISVLVVDDNRDAGDSLGFILKRLGVQVQIVYDGREAVEALEKYRPSIALLDIGMPGMDGYEVIRRAKENGQCQDVVFVAVTGWGQEEDRQRSKAAGFDHHLVKPVDLGKLQALLGLARGAELRKS